MEYKVLKKEEVQVLWETKQNKLAIPMGTIAKVKDCPIDIFLAYLMVSQKEDSNYSDATGRGARITSLTKEEFINKKLEELRQIDANKIKKGIETLISYNSPEFELKNETDDKAYYKNFYRMDYSKGMITIDIEIIHFLLEHLDNKSIQIYLAIASKCGDEFKMFTYAQMATSIGLSSSYVRPPKACIDKLLEYELIEQRSNTTQYQHRFYEYKLTHKYVSANRCGSCKTEFNIEDIKPIVLGDGSNSKELYCKDCWLEAQYNVRLNDYYYEISEKDPNALRELSRAKESSEGLTNFQIYHTIKYIYEILEIPYDDYYAFKVGYYAMEAMKFYKHIDDLKKAKTYGDIPPVKIDQSNKPAHKPDKSRLRINNISDM